MANHKFFTQDQIDTAKLTLAELPDLTPNRITRDDMLESLREVIVATSTQKGYSAADIKKALETIDIQVSEKAISDVLRNNATKKPRTRKVSRTKSAEQMPKQESESQ